MWRGGNCIRKERVSFFGRVNLEVENIIVKEKCGNKVVGKRSLMFVEYWFKFLDKEK